MKNKLAVVTGASRGIGREIALALSGEGFRVFGLARHATWDDPGGVVGLRTDLTDMAAIDSTVEFINRKKRLDVLVHAAGMFYQGNDLNEVARQNAVNVQAPYYLTRKLIPRLEAAKGQVIFLNSLAALGSERETIAQYAATKKALKIVADDLRKEVNSLGIRVTSLYLGQVATEMQKANYEAEGWNYNPDSLMQPSDVAAMVVDILRLPVRAEITDLTLRSSTVKAA